MRRGLLQYLRIICINFPSLRGIYEHEWYPCRSGLEIWLDRWFMHPFFLSFFRLWNIILFFFLSMGSWQSMSFVHVWCFPLFFLSFSLSPNDKWNHPSDVRSFVRVQQQRNVFSSKSKPRKERKKERRKHVFPKSWFFLDRVTYFFYVLIARAIVEYTYKKERDSLIDSKAKFCRKRKLTGELR